MDAVRLQVLLERIGNLIRSELRKAAAEHGLALAQLDALQYLALANRYSDTPAAIGEFLGATKGTISQTLLTLESKGLIKKKPDPADKRVVHCALTRSGRSIAESTLPAKVLANAAKELETDPIPGLEAILVAMQRGNENRSFGVCRSCAHFTRTQGRFSCGLTGEPLSTEDAAKICREHLPIVA
jgi:DNA-binding MarR family transcriptional regulator